MLLFFASEISYSASCFVNYNVNCLIHKDEHHESRGGKDILHNLVSSVLFVFSCFARFPQVDEPLDLAERT